MLNRLDNLLWKCEQRNCAVYLSIIEFKRVNILNILNHFFAAASCKCYSLLRDLGVLGDKFWGYIEYFWGYVRIFCPILRLDKKFWGYVIVWWEFWGYDESWLQSLRLGRKFEVML